MLNDLIVGRAALGPRPIDVHRFAVFSCDLKRAVHRLKVGFGRLFGF